MPLSAHLPDLNALQLLVAVSRTGSISAAARAVGIRQQTASERLAGIERQVGVPLVRRTASGSTLTDAGTVVVEWAARLLATAEEVDAAIAALRVRRDRELRIVASMTIAEHLLPRWLAAFGRRAPDGTSAASVSLVATNSRAVIDAVQQGRADLGFIEGAAVPADLHRRDIATDELILVAGPGDPLAGRRSPLRPDQVASLALSSREAGSGTREVVDAALAEHDLVLHTPAVEFTTGTGLLEAVKAGAPPAFLSSRTVAHDLETGAVVAVPVRGLALRRTLRAIWSAGAQPPAGPVRDLLAIAARMG